ncbi:MAG: hypothetical protein GY834_15960 [Bacteroidetes bacterium]|nr:hypothetical protein [Bacteroidota bacterium]
MKRFLFVLALIILVSFTSSIFVNAQTRNTDQVKVLVLLGEWFGDTYFPLKKKIKSFNWKMYRIGVDENYLGCYNKARDVALHSDILIKDLKDFSKYDCLIIPSGPQFRKFNENEEVLKFVRDAHKAGLVIASFCTGNMVVNKSGLIDKKEMNEIFPEKVTEVKERILLGPRGGGPPPGDGFKSAPIDEICRAVAKKLGVKIKEKTGAETK